LSSNAEKLELAIPTVQMAFQTKVTVGLHLAGIAWLLVAQGKLKS
jgi:hypothetical protein